jgi:integrase
MILDAEGTLSKTIRIEDSVSKGRSGGVIPIADDLYSALLALQNLKYSLPNSNVVCSERANSFSSQAIVNLFRQWYKTVGFEGCSSHSGRRTFITNAARNIGRFGGSIRDVQILARHRSLGMTQSYIEIDNDALSKVVNI